MTSSTGVGETRFIADAMLGRLARWLRVLGFDTTYDPAIDDPELVSISAAESRVLLTRDRHLVAHRRPARALLITVDDPLEQLREVIATYKLAPPAELFTRCLVCNSMLRAATENEEATLRAGAARELRGPVRHCSGCERMYWAGSHTRRMRETLARELPGWAT